MQAFRVWWRMEQTKPKQWPIVTDHLCWVWLSRFWSYWQEVLIFVQPRTVITWQRRRFRDDRQHVSRAGKPGRPGIAEAVRILMHGRRPGQAFSQIAIFRMHRRGTMSCQRSLAARTVAILAIVLGLSGVACAVTAVGSAKRVDQDAGTSSVYFFGNFSVVQAGTGGFAVAWEENTKPDNPIVYERIRFRVYSNAFAPVAGPQAANQSGRRMPNLVRLVPLGADHAYLVYALTRDTDHPDHPEVRDAFGQTIALASGTATGRRRWLNTIGIWDSLIGIAAGLADGRAVVAWYEVDGFDPAPGRFISGAGVPQALSLDFACCDKAQLTGLLPLGTGFVASYLRNSIFGGANGLHGRVYKANGQPLGAAKHLTVSTLNPFLRSLSNGRIAVFRFVPVGEHYKLVVQLYDKHWEKIGVAQTVIADVTTTKYLDIAPTLDGGVFLVRTLQNRVDGPYTRSIRRLNADFAPVGADYTFASAHGFDFFRIAALSNNRAVVVFRNVVSGRQRLLARIVHY
jgi:hypothetical protein